MSVEIRSYRAVFDLERRIYRIDRLRLNPGGVPVRGVLYFLLAVALVQALGRLPLLGVVVSAVPWYLLDLALPACGAVLLTLIGIEGRPSHLAVWALVRHRFDRRMPPGLHVRRSGAPPGDVDTPGARWWPEDLLVLPDGSDSRLRRLRYCGPGAVLVTIAHERVQPALPMSIRAALVVREGSPRRTLAQGEVIALERKALMRIG
jgi:hypothetical protein